MNILRWQALLLLFTGSLVSLYDTGTRKIKIHTFEQPLTLLCLRTERECINILHLTLLHYSTTLLSTPLLKHTPFILFTIENILKCLTGTKSMGK